MSDEALLVARCDEGHEWDVWATHDGQKWTVPTDDLTCPECEQRAVLVYDRADE